MMGERTQGASGLVWAMVLAGGESNRVRPFVERWLGRPRPKQYCSFVGTRSMFQHALDRAARLAAPDRVVVVAARGHEAEVRDQLESRRVWRVLFQPTACDTAAGVFLSLTAIRVRDPQATVVLCPSDHFIYPEDRFLACARRAIEAAERMTGRLVLLGARPDRLELDYGWIEPGAALGEGEARSVSAFIEKPGLRQADEGIRRGALWNTLVLAAKAETLWELGRRWMPDVVERFARLGAAMEQPEEASVLEEISRGMPRRNLSSDLLQRAPDRVAVLELAGVLWSDWGRPERIAETLRRIDRPPAFPLECLPHPFAPRPALHRGGAGAARA